MNWKIWGAVAVVVVIAVVLLGTQKSSAPEPVVTGEPAGTTAPLPENNAPDTVVTPSPVGAGPVSVDSVVDAILADAAQDQALVQAEDANADLAIQDAADLNDLGAAYTGNEF